MPPSYSSSHPHASPANTENFVPTPIQYPFNVIYTTATVPKSLSNYLTTAHPSMTQLISPKVHMLPKSLETEYVTWTGGNKMADIERRLRNVWADDSIERSHRRSQLADDSGDDGLSKIVIFCNKSTKVHALSAYLDTKGIKNIPLHSTSDARTRGSNKYLGGFLKGIGLSHPTPTPKESASHQTTKHLMRPLIPSSSPMPNLTNIHSEQPSDPRSQPHVLITTSLLSRGLDFAPQIKHVFIIDEPRNLVDFLHRAGRAGRAGQHGKVVVFGKTEGRGSERGKEVRKRIASLSAQKGKVSSGRTSVVMGKFGGRR